MGVSVQHPILCSIPGFVGVVRKRRGEVYKSTSMRVSTSLQRNEDMLGV